jgi:hypothetical protein
MHIMEEVAVVIEAAEADDLCKKDEEPDDACSPNECRVGDKGELPEATAGRLNDNMKAKKVFTPADPPKKDDHWDLDHCTAFAFPYQSHHLIPKKHLPKHDVCVWLAKKCKNGQYELTKSTNYDTDDARNGMALPFASNTYQWKHTKSPIEKTKICNTMMEKTQRQLHQGSHTYDDYGEEDNLHLNEEPGYLGAADELLNEVHCCAIEHIDFCGPCRQSKTKPVKVRPLEKVVLAIHVVSAQLQGIITLKKRFVSERAAAYLGSHVIT